MMAAGSRYAGGVRYPDGGGLTAAERSRRERVRLEAALDAGPAAWGRDEEQCWTLARVTDLVRRRFRVSPLAPSLASRALLASLAFERESNLVRDVFPAACGRCPRSVATRCCWPSDSSMSRECPGHGPTSRRCRPG